MTWINDRALTLVLMAMFLVFLAGQYVTGFHEYTDAQATHHESPIALSAYATTGHWWESVFENWESEFLQMAVFVLLTTQLVQKGSPESRRAHAREAVDADPRDFTNKPDVPWPVRRGGWILRLYENSLGLAFVLLFLISWAGHAAGGYFSFASDQMGHGLAGRSSWIPHLIALLVRVHPELAKLAPFDRRDGVLAVYLRQRGSPESKPVHASHGVTIDKDQRWFPAGLEIVDGAEEFEEALLLARLRFRRFEHLPHRPAHVRFHGGIEQLFRRQREVDVLERRMNTFKQQRNSIGL